MKVFKQGKIKNLSFTNLLMSLQKRQLTRNVDFNYYTPDPKKDEIEDVKSWLNNTKPQFLCIFFTNTWNPICKQYNPDYTKFTTRTASFAHLMVDTDKFPKLKWFFDCKHDPAFKFYYYGANVENLGGCNFDRAVSSAQRIQEYVSSDNNNLDVNFSKVEYEQPYYQFENELDDYGMKLMNDPGQVFQVPGFSGQMTIFRYIPLENYLVHKRLKK